VNAAAATKKTSKPTKIHDIPLKRRFFFAGAGRVAVGSSSLPAYGAVYPAML